jgi:hypothetical protein
MATKREKNSVSLSPSILKRRLSPAARVQVEYKKTIFSSKTQWSFPNLPYIPPYFLRDQTSLLSHGNFSCQFDDNLSTLRLDHFSDHLNNFLTSYKRSQP